jgi:hypothetical protein
MTTDNDGEVLQTQSNDCFLTSWLAVKRRLGFARRIFSGIRLKESQTNKQRSHIASRDIRRAVSEFQEVMMRVVGPARVRNHIAAAGILSIMTVALSASRDDAAGQMSPLNGIAGVAVTVDAVAPAVERLGLTRSQLVELAEQTVRQGGIRIDPSTQVQLRVAINGIELETASGVRTGVAYTVSISVDEDAVLRTC